jgi:ComEC/Rec2-related protein
LIAGQIGALLEDEDLLPGLTVVFLLFSLFFFGIFRYVHALYPIPTHHLSRVLKADDPRTKWKIVGRIVEEPSVKNDYLEVLIEPETVQESPRFKSLKKKTPAKSKSKKAREKKSGSLTPPKTEPSSSVLNTEDAAEPEAEDPPEVKVTGGLVLVTVFEEHPSYNTVRFNQKIELVSKFSIPSSRRNPGSLDFQKNLINRGIFRTTRLASPRDGTMSIIEESQGGSLWYRLALFVRTEFLKVTKQTMPYPESSFLGGVLLGLKGGLPPLVTTEFRKTGVSHVLAVSGLHVTIISGLLFGIFTMFRVPIRIFTPFIVFMLFTFALIVGWPSSAVRAAMMNSLFLISRAYLRDYGFKQSIMFALSLSACYILTMSPLQLTEPSFTLSFMAIYALAMFSGPSEQLLRECLRGPGLLFAANAGLLYYIVVSIKRDFVLHDWFFIISGAYFLMVLFVSKQLSKTSGFQSFSFEMLPQWMSSFAAAQLGIFLGMMGPLSAYYFGSMSLSAPIANFIAIPLIGLIVQAGMIAGVLGAFVPVIGLHLALLINAANWLAVKFFLGMAHFFAVLIPFPRVSQPSFGMILLYYALLHLYFYWDTIRDYSLALSGAISELWEDPDYKWSLGLVGGLIAGVFFYFGIFGLSRVQSAPSMRLTLLDVGYGSSLLLERKGRFLLVDAGMRDDLSGYDIGERVIVPALSEKHAGHLHSVILTTCLPEHITGLLTILNSYRVGNLYLSFPLPANGEIVSFPDFLTLISLSDRKVDEALKNNQIISTPPNFYTEQTYNAYNSLVRAIQKQKIPVHPLTAKTRIPGFEDCLEIIPLHQENTIFEAFNHAPILIVNENKKKIAYVNGNVYNWQKHMKDPLDILLISSLPYNYERFEDFLRRSTPSHVAMSFRKPSGWLLEKFYLDKIMDGRIIQFNRRLKRSGLTVYRTDQNGAIQIDSIRDRLSVVPFIAADPQR